MRPTNLLNLNTYSENMASATKKRNFECDSYENYGEGTVKKRRYPDKMCSSPDILKSSVKCSSPPRKTDLKLRSEKIVDNTRGESKKRLRNRPLCCDDSDKSDHSSSSAASSSSKTSPMTPDCKDEPLFTYNQVILICENVLKESENQIRHEYDRILNTKLAEQYDAFVKFAYDQIHKCYENRTPSYVS